MNFRVIFLQIILCSLFQITGCSQYQKGHNHPIVTDAENSIEALHSLLVANTDLTKETLDYFDTYWKNGYVPMLLDLLYIAGDQVDSRSIIKLLEKKTGQNYGKDVFKWLEWLWNKEEEILPYQGDWMASLYKTIDPKFEKYFLNRTDQSQIRLDEVRWGGVFQDGIPPLRGPNMISVSQANYLDDEDVVFGISINGDHRAYPKRILAWHEMFVDDIGGASIAGVYCTLCGTVIAYNTTFEGVNYRLGTSGFLYRSNKLMYDQTTQSLWNTIEGKPVIGPLIDAGIELESHSVVTTTWGDWKILHPDTKVLSLKTGHRRNYDEGVAYKRYFATDELMFNVPVLDDRLRNKDEVLIVRAEGYQSDPLAISAQFLSKNPVFHETIGNTDFVVLTDRSGANRVYRSEGYKFVSLSDAEVVDANGTRWQVFEEKLKNSSGEILDRLPYHRMFWFAWFNTYMSTRLIH